MTMSFPVYKRMKEDRILTGKRLWDDIKKKRPSRGEAIVAMWNNDGSILVHTTKDGKYEYGKGTHVQFLPTELREIIAAVQSAGKPKDKVKVFEGREGLRPCLFPYSGVVRAFLQGTDVTIEEETTVNSWGWKCKPNTILDQSAGFMGDYMKTCIKPLVGATATDWQAEELCGIKRRKRVRSNRLSRKG